MTWSAEQSAIFDHWRDNAPVAAALRDESDWNGQKFNPPKINPASPSSAVWVRFSQRAVQRSGRPFAIGGSAPTYRQGLIYQQVFYPRGFGDSIADSIINAAVALFHRQLLSASPQIQCGDTHPPERIPPDDESAEWMQVNVLTPYEVIEH